MKGAIVAYNPNFDCDVCSAKKGKENRWLIGQIFSVIQGGVARPWPAIRPWTEDIARDSKHICSDQCALTWFTKELELLGR